MNTTEIDYADIVAALESRIADECDTVDREERFDDSLNEFYSFEKVGGPFAHMSPAQVLKECDPVAYRCGLNDSENGELVEVSGDYYEQRECEAVKDELQGELETREGEIEEEVEELESEDNPPEHAAEIEELGRELIAVRAALAALKKHSF